MLDHDKGSQGIREIRAGTEEDRLRVGRESALPTGRHSVQSTLHVQRRVRLAWCTMDPINGHRSDRVTRVACAAVVILYTWSVSKTCEYLRLSAATVDSPVRRVRFALARLTSGERPCAPSRGCFAYLVPEMIPSCERDLLWMNDGSENNLHNKELPVYTIHKRAFPHADTLGNRLDRPLVSERSLADDVRNGFIS